MKKSGVVDVRFQTKNIGVGQSWVKRVLEETLCLEKKRNQRVGVLLTGNRQIRKINRRHLGHDWATDVISFGYGPGLGPDKGTPFLGDLVVSVEMARAKAKELEIPYREELGRYLVHGLLHLLGYRDKTKKDSKRMHARQEAIVKKVIGL